jgi:hypothetical protein
VAVLKKKKKEVTIWDKDILQEKYVSFREKREFILSLLLLTLDDIYFCPFCVGIVTRIDEKTFPYAKT